MGVICEDLGALTTAQAKEFWIRQLLPVSGYSRSLIIGILNRELEQ